MTPVLVTPAAELALLEMEARHGTGEHIQPGTVVTAEIETKPGHHADIVVSYRWEHLGQKCGLKRRHRSEDLTPKGFTLTGEAEPIQIVSASEAARYVDADPMRWTLDVERASQIMGVAMGDSDPEDGTVPVMFTGAGTIADPYVIEVHAEPGIHDMQTMRNKRAVAWLDEQVEEVCKLGRLQ